MIRSMLRGVLSSRPTNQPAVYCMIMFYNELLMRVSGVACTAVEQIADPPANRRVVCYPVQLATPAPLPAAVVDRKEQGEMTMLTYRGETQRLNTPYFHKLVSSVNPSVCLLSVLISTRGDQKVLQFDMTHKWHKQNFCFIFQHNRP